VLVSNSRTVHGRMRENRAAMQAEVGHRVVFPSERVTVKHSCDCIGGKGSWRSQGGKGNRARLRYWARKLIQNKRKSTGPQLRWVWLCK
jgi:hypothetical protein